MIMIGEDNKERLVHLK